MIYFGNKTADLVLLAVRTDLERMHPEYITVWREPYLFVLTASVKDIPDLEEYDMKAGFSNPFTEFDHLPDYALQPVLRIICRHLFLLF